MSERTSGDSAGSSRLNPFDALTERQQGIVLAFQDAGARTPGSALPLHLFGIEPDADVNALVALGVLVPADTSLESFYAPLGAQVLMPAMNTRTIRSLFVALITVLVLGGAVLAVRAIMR